MPTPAAKFAWPPRPPAASVGPAIAEPKPLPQQPAQIPDGSGSTWSRIEGAWLDVQTPPLFTRLQSEGWSPAPEGTYCFRCGQEVSPGEVDADGCRHCRAQSMRWERLVCLGPYQRPLDAVIRDVKFRSLRRAGMQLGAMLGRRLAGAIGRAGLAGARVVLVPVPVSRRRRMSRGIDHALVIARAAAGPCGGVVARLLGRVHRARQLEVAASLRERNAAGSMYPRRIGLGRWLGASGGGAVSPWGLVGGPGPVLVVLVDDVMTTGATLRAAARTVERGCKRMGSTEVRVWAGVLAVTPHRGAGVGGGAGGDAAAGRIEGLKGGGEGG